ncbi:ArsR/SmtB family transcription factor [Pontibacter sp. 13R65]|uniref:ArsR/SmtB family transcription factor n=1 Tax=Pontibacter sp. 13R65 TaxID=3127458 RepID=UPI00301CBB56
MGISKTDLFTERQNELAKVAKVLAHPARIAIVDYLIEANTCINGELVNSLGLAQATISQHLRELKEIGLIKGSIEGATVCYCIDAERWRELQTLFNELFQRFTGGGNNCC